MYQQIYAFGSGSTGNEFLEQRLTILCMPQSTKQRIGTRVKIHWHSLADDLVRPSSEISGQQARVEKTFSSVQTEELHSVDFF